MAIKELRCDTCLQVRIFEQPPCPDQHGSDCPEWVCASCRTAMLIAPVVLLDRRPRVTVRARQRRAA
jgi:hypothetical protein